jgi:hypothetical protein
LNDEYAYTAHDFSADVTVCHAIYNGRGETPAHLIECKPAALINRVSLAKLFTWTLHERT